MNTDGTSEAKDTPRSRLVYLPFAIAIGVAAGMVAGLLLDNIGLWIGIGAAAGVIAGVFLALVFQAPGTPEDDAPNSSEHP